VRGAVLAVLGLWSAPALLRCYGLLARLMLARPGADEVNRRITHLTQTRAETIDVQSTHLPGRRLPFGGHGTPLARSATRRDNSRRPQA
jgi:hypothetical protein